MPVQRMACQRDRRSVFASASRRVTVALVAFDQPYSLLLNSRLRAGLDCPLEVATLSAEDLIRGDVDCVLLASSSEQLAEMSTRTS